MTSTILIPPSCTIVISCSRRRPCLFSASALPVEVLDCGRRPQDQKPQLSAGAGAEDAAHWQQAAVDRHTTAEQLGWALVPPQLPPARGLWWPQEVWSHAISVVTNYWLLITLKTYCWPLNSFMWRSPSHLFWFLFIFGSNSAKLE